MKIEINSEGDVMLADVFSGVGIQTDDGLYGIAQRDGGIEVTLNGKYVWSNHELPVRLPDGSGAFVASLPLPKDHWLYADHDNEPPFSSFEEWASIYVSDGGGGHFLEVPEAKHALRAVVRDAAKYAIRASTMNGRDTDFDPDAMVQNFVIGMAGYYGTPQIRSTEPEEAPTAKPSTSKEEELYAGVLKAFRALDEVLAQATRMDPTVELCLFVGKVSGAWDALAAVVDAGAPRHSPDEAPHPLPGKIEFQ